MTVRLVRRTIQFSNVTLRRTETAVSLDQTFIFFLLQKFSFFFAQILLRKITIARERYCR